MSTTKQTRKKTTAPSKAQARADTPPQSATGDGVTHINEDERRHMVAEAAYYRALSRGFAAGGEVEDWLAAEREIEQLFGRANAGSLARKTGVTPTTRSTGEGPRPRLQQ